MKKSILVSILIGAALLIVGDRPIEKYYYILITDPPLNYMVKDMEEQIQCAKKAGFVIKKPTLRMMRWPYEYDPSHAHAHGLAYMNLNLIMLIPYALYRTIAHELGHILDGQTHRKGHPFFKDKENWDNEVFADAIRDIIIKECKPANPDSAG